MKLLRYALVLVLVLSGLGSGTVAQAAWEPGPARFGVATQYRVPVPMADGTVLRADVHTPTIAGSPAPGPFPVLLVQSPYGRAESAAELAYFVQRGYIAVAADTRGTGASEGAWSPFAPIEASDGVTLVNWAAQLPNSTGAVGLQGGSYLGINQLFTAAAVGKNSPLKAIFPIVAGNDLYRDLVAMGGIPDAEFMPLWLALTGAGTLTDPLLEAASSGSTLSILDLLKLELQHGGAVASSQIPLLISMLSGGPEAYDEEFWQARRPADILDDVVANEIPAFLVGGWDDLFQRGALMNYSALQNAWAGRPTSAPMSQDQPVTSRYQLLMGPWYHAPGPEIDLLALELAWYDHWLKGIDTGITDTDTPLHLKQVGSERWVDTKTYPMTGATPTTFSLGAGRTGTAPASANDGVLSRGPTTSGGDWISWTPANSACTRSTAQWIGGFFVDPNCATSNTEREKGPASLVYTSDPVTSETVIAGPISATIYASATTVDTQWVVTVTDVAPDGSSRPLTEGALIGSQRALDPARSWYAADGSLLMPYHPHTRASVKPVPFGQVTRYDVEVYPTFAAIAPGHRIRVNITTADTPHLAPSLAQLPGLLGGIYQMRRGQSSVTIPLAPATQFTTPCTICT